MKNSLLRRRDRRFDDPFPDDDATESLNPFASHQCTKKRYFNGSSEIPRIEEWECSESKKKSRALYPFLNLRQIWGLVSSSQTRDEDQFMTTVYNERTYGTGEVEVPLEAPGMDGILEIEEEFAPVEGEEDLLGLNNEPVRTSSGLYLTHRTVSQRDRPRESKDVLLFGSKTPFLRDHTAMEPQTRKRVVVWWKLMLSGCFVVLVAVLGVGCLSIQQRRSRDRAMASNDRILKSTTQKTPTMTQQRRSRDRAMANNDRILKSATQNTPTMTLPTNNIEATADTHTPPQQTPHNNHHIGRRLRQLKEEFDQWATHHKRSYNTEEERRHRFQIWLDNHHRTLRKNKRHGPCKLTGKEVFGSNHFKDLTQEEFQQRFLTGYNPPLADQLDNHRMLTTDKAYQSSQDNKARKLKHDLELLPKLNKRYIEHWEPNTQQKQNYNNKNKKRRYIDHWQPQPSTKEEQTYPNISREQTQSNPEKTNMKSQQKKYPNKRHRRQDTNNYSPNTSSSNSHNPFQMCGYTNWSCWLQWLFDSSSYGGMMEPTYDADSYPEALDWRDLGAVSSVHTQGQCGACWAIAAVETVESAYYIGTGTLYDLAEEEVILCDDTCDMCYGGWPQNAYEYVMKNGGLPAERTMEFNGDFLLAITMVKNGQSDYYSEDAVDEYLNGICPAYYGEGNGHKDSGDNNNENNQDSPRYGQIQGYGYATDRCICYTNGQGCDCDEQDEELAIANVASYGPAVVCIDASTWQDYEGGIMTAESGCSSEFLSMNHCVQVVGYAFIDSSDDVEDGEHRREEEHSHSQKEGGGREGYWIVRNQWSSYWGMNGYAYVAMGSGNQNTCGILNDMTQAYM